MATNFNVLKATSGQELLIDTDLYEVITLEAQMATKQSGSSCNAGR